MQTSLQSFVQNNSIPEPNSGCWLWLGRLDVGTGYAKQGMVAVHRLSYRVFKGDIPTKFDIDHLCRVISCVNPDHLEAVTRKINLERGIGTNSLVRRGLVSAN